MTSTISKESCLFLFELELAGRLVFIEKGAELRSSVEQSNPLLVIERDRKAAEAINAYAAFFTDPEFEGPRSATASLLFQFRQTRFQFVVTRLGHDSSWDRCKLKGLYLNVQAVFPIRRLERADQRLQCSHACM